MSRKGMRIGEAMALTDHYIDWERGVILINKNVPAGIGHLEDSTKTGENRHQDTLSPILRPCLKALLTAAIPCVQLVKAYPGADFRRSPLLISSRGLP
jgi:integrase